MNRTQTRLARLGIFNAINIDVVPDSARNDRKLNVIVNCTFDTPLEATVELNASSKSNSYIGPGILLGLTNRNKLMDEDGFIIINKTLFGYKMKGKEVVKDFGGFKTYYIRPIEMESKPIDEKVFIPDGVEIIDTIP